MVNKHLLTGWGGWTPLTDLRKNRYYAGQDWNCLCPWKVPQSWISQDLRVGENPQWHEGLLVAWYIGNVLEVILNYLSVFMCWLYWTIKATVCGRDLLFAPGGKLLWEHNPIKNASFAHHISEFWLYLDCVSVCVTCKARLSWTVLEEGERRCALLIHGWEWEPVLSGCSFSISNFQTAELVHINTLLS